MAETKTKTKEEPRERITLKEIFEDWRSVDVSRSMMHQAFEIPGGGTQSSLNSGRPGLKDLQLRIHPDYGLIGLLNKKYFISPNAPNVIVGHE